MEKFRELFEAKSGWRYNMMTGKEGREFVDEGTHGRKYWDIGGEGTAENSPSHREILTWLKKLSYTDFMEAYNGEGPEWAISMYETGINDDADPSEIIVIIEEGIVMYGYGVWNFTRDFNKKQVWKLLKNADV